jgi:DNA-binding transcriptional regulator YiaG
MTVSNWESGRSVPKLTPVQFKKLLKILQITVDELPDQFGFPSDADG